jgi:mRNA-degrading endonuclease RelE of RelBE toxin-antitoxin system
METVKIGLHREFLKALISLSESERKQVLRFLEFLTNGTETPGLRVHLIESSKGCKYVSYSPNMDLRVLAVRSGDQTILVYVNHHDDAYLWANQHEPLIDKGYFEVFKTPIGEVEELPNGEVTNEYGKSLVNSLKNDGFPEFICEILENCHGEDDLLESISCLSPEWQDTLLSIAAGKPVSFEQLVKHGSSRVVMLQDDEELRLAIMYPLDEWRLFLHSTQKKIVLYPYDQNLIVEGGPGTGKSISLLYRALTLALRTYPKINRS